ncbi:hypothetical protein MVEN_00176300 [Mycena venus]|uniref:Uncharacterized protein n=1 Tax=Mycena venus TaxID=2733690 RepID=A0A8H7DBP0_9AGAR|nr:hypothetical protein MVEN_00176300 [Mycena venus]
MSNDRRYSAQDAIAWEAYDDATMAFVKGEKGHPGPAPPGYKESYMLRHPKAPLPEKFPATEAAWANRHVSAPVQQPDYNGVRLSNDAFGTLLHHHALVNHQLGEMISTRINATTTPQRAIAHFGGNRPHPKAEFFHRTKAPFAAKGWQRRHVAKSVGKGKGKKPYHGYRARARVAATAVKVDTAAVAGPSDAKDVAHEVAPVVEEAQEQTVAPEDVFMADYTLVKDEEEEGALFSDDEKEPVVVA